jgi:hypothetical protein
MDKRVILIGDIHGCWSEFQEILTKLAYQKKRDRLISLGDLIHKGPDSVSVVRYFIKNELEVLRGNHEDCLLKALLGEREMYPEATEILEHCGLSKKKLIAWLRAMPLYLKEKDFLAVHAGFSPWCKLSENKEQDYFTVRTADAEHEKLSSKASGDGLEPWYKAFSDKRESDRIVAFGHWAGPRIKHYKNMWGLDTGCCYGGKLTALVLPSQKLVQVSSHQTRQFDY